MQESFVWCSKKRGGCYRTCIRSRLNSISKEGMDFLLVY